MKASFTLVQFICLIGKKTKTNQNLKLNQTPALRNELSHLLNS